MRLCGFPRLAEGTTERNLQMSKLPDLEKLRIICYPEPLLRKTAQPVKKVEGFQRDLAHRMAQLMAEAAGIGLAANQVGWLERIVVVSISGEPTKAEAYINPRIVAKSGSVIDCEGCLSVPGAKGKVRRAEEVTVVATRLDGQEAEIQAKGLLARAWQHEIDHLDGLLFLDKLSPASKIAIASNLRKLEEEYIGTTKT